MTSTTTTGTMIISSRTVDHRTMATYGGGPASCFQRVARPVGGSVGEPNYAARRLGALFVALGAVVVLTALVNSVLVGLGGSPASAAETSPAADAARVDAPMAVHVAQPGDSIWSIADRYRGEVDRARYVDALIAHNGSTTIIVGQAVHLP